MPRTKRRAILQAGPFDRVLWRATFDAPPSSLRYLSNGYILPGGQAVQRPQFDLLGWTLGTKTQLLYDFWTTAGVQHTVAIIDGEITEYNWSTDTSSTVVSTANLTSASIVLSTTARCYAVTFDNKMIISDGTNTPFAWDGTSGAGGLTELTNAPVFFGQPTVYYGKLFAIKNTDQLTIVWSEENDPTTGYEAGGFNNAWTLGQTNSEHLVGILGTNEALYYWRKTGIGIIRGAVTPDFSSSGTHDAVSESLGLIHTSVRLYTDGRVFFADQYRRPWMLVGGTLEPIWEQLSQAFTAGTASMGFEDLGLSETFYLRSPATFADDAGIAIMPSLDAVMFKVPSSTTQPLLVFGAHDGRFHGVWTAPTMTAQQPVLATIENPGTNGFAGEGLVIQGTAGVLFANLRFSGEDGGSIVDGSGSPATFTTRLIGPYHGLGPGGTGNQNWIWLEVAARLHLTLVVAPAGSATAKYTMRVITSQQRTAGAAASTQDVTPVVEIPSGTLGEQILTRRVGILEGGSWAIVSMDMTNPSEVHSLGSTGWTIEALPDGVARE